MKRNTRLLLSFLQAHQRTPFKIHDLGRNIALCTRATKYHLRLLERSGMIVIDRSERPHAYEVTEKGKLSLDAKLPVSSGVA